MTPMQFRYAHPVWEKGKETEMNYTLLFTAEVPKNADALLRIAASSVYQLFINGVFIAAGPARAGHGFYRVDEHQISKYLSKECNTVSILCTGYNTNNYCYLDVPSFLCCEITAGEACLAKTGEEALGCGFSAFHYTKKMQKAERYSFQRTFAEIYNLSSDALLPVTLAETEEKRFISREVYYPEYERVAADAILEKGTVARHVPEKYPDRRFINQIGPAIKGFTEEELEENSFFDALELCLTPTESNASAAEAVNLAEASYVTYRLSKNLTGFISLTASVKEDTTLYLTFDEVYNNNRVDITRIDCANVVVWHLKGGGTYSLMTLEPYTLRYLNVIAMGGAAEISVPMLIRYDFPRREIRKAVPMPDGVLQSIYDAAIETFRQNTLDIYMDCPSRERAGWLCDSFFTARTEFELTGRSTVEHAFLDNFLMTDHFEYLPEGMLPMCYPADHNDGIFIPNWAMWFVLELAEYLERTGDRAFIEQAKDKVYGLIDYFKDFENADGLIEKLTGWVFLEWSRSNDLVQDINYPSNMLYAKMLETAAGLYGDAALKEKAASIKDVIRAQSFMGDFFCDNAVYNANGKAELSREATESCQYYAFFTGVATPETYPALWNTLVNDFGPERKDTGKYPEVAFANAFIGNYLRLELLYQNGLHQKVTDNIRGYFKHMADKTGTLWENDGDYASCNHGFASHVIRWLNGIYG